MDTVKLNDNFSVQLPNPQTTLKDLITNKPIKEAGGVKTPLKLKGSGKIPLSGGSGDFQIVPKAEAGYRVTVFNEKSKPDSDPEGLFHYDEEEELGALKQEVYGEIGATLSGTVYNISFTIAGEKKVKVAFYRKHKLNKSARDALIEDFADYKTPFVFDRLKDLVAGRDITAFAREILKP
ncbi:MAG: hypothetical protein AAGA45_06495 [Verrucomicrobiota bacterium]